MSEAARGTRGFLNADRRAVIGLAVAVALALALRLALVAATPHFHPVYDAADFDRIARTIADTGHYPHTYYAKPGTATALNPPAYPHLLGLTYKVLGHHWNAGRVLGALLGTLAVLLLALIAWRLWGPVAGVIAGVLGAFYPPLVAVNASLISEALFLPVMLGLVLLLLTRPRVEGSAAWLVAGTAGALCGLAALTRSIGVLLVIVTLVWVGLQKLSARTRVGMGAVVLLVTCAVIAPWTIRNTRHFQDFTPVATEAGPSAVGTYNAVSRHAGPVRGTWRPVWQLPQYAHLLVDGLDESQLDARWRSDAINYAWGHPGYPFVALGLNGLRMFGLGPGYRYLESIWYSEMGVPHRAWGWTRVGVYVMALLALFGLFAGRRMRRRRDAYLWLVPVLMFLGSAFIIGGPRYRVPVDPFLVLAATSGLSAVAYRIAPAVRSRAVTKTAPA